MTPGAAQPPAGVVLIVDDDRPIADFLAAAVAEAGYAPVVATSGRQALALARVRWPALLIAALRAAAASAGHPAPPAILITSASPRAARGAGADAVLDKPFDLTDLEALLRRFLGAPAGAS